MCTVDKEGNVKNMMWERQKARYGKTKKLWRREGGKSAAAPWLNSVLDEGLLGK